MIKYLLFSFSLFLFCSQATFAQDEKSEKSKKSSHLKREGELNYPKKLLVNPDFDFKLKSNEKGKLNISFYKNQSKAVTIKIYDITGNLVLQETVSENGSFNKEYNLAYYKPNFFVVEVGSSQYNKTKSIITE